MRMFAGLGSAKDTNKRFHLLVNQGQTGLSTAFDMPTLMGYDTDSPKARGECGKCGVAIDSLMDMEDLFEGLPIERITTSMTINPAASILWAMYIAVAEKRGIDREIIGGTIQNDMLKEFIAQKTFMCPPVPSVRIITDTVEFGTKEVPKWNTISISGYHIREAGSTAVQELAFTLADGIAYTQEAIGRGLNVDDFAPRFSFFFNSHLDFFEEVAKFGEAHMGQGHERAVQCQRPKVLVAEISYADCRMLAHRPTALQQCGKDGTPGIGSGYGWDPVPAYKFVGRSLGHTH